MPTASITVSAPRPPVSFRIAAAAWPSLLLTVAVAPKLFGDSQPVVVQIDHDDLGGAVELGREQGGQADRPRAHNRHGAAGLRPCR